MTQAAQDKEFQTHMQQLDGLLEQLKSITDPAARDAAGRIIQGIMEFHGAAVEKLLEHVSSAGELGQTIIDDFGEDDLVSSLLLLYGLHPLHLETRVRNALEQVRPYLASHGGNVELLQVTEDGAVHLQMQGSCHGCPSSSQTLKNSIEQAIYDKAPDVTAIHVAGIEQAPVVEHHGHNGNGFVPVEALLSSHNGKHHLRGTPS